MDNDRELEDLMDLDSTESSSSSNPGLFESQTPFVLELHDIRKDDPLPGENNPPPLDARIKKHKKKKKRGPPVNHSSGSSGNVSDSSSVTPNNLESKEEFYDAHESYHAINKISSNPATQGPVIAAGRLQVHSETDQNPKLTSPILSLTEQTTTSTARKEPSTITKPTLPPE